MYINSRLRRLSGKHSRTAWDGRCMNDTGMAYNHNPGKKSTIHRIQWQSVQVPMSNQGSIQWTRTDSIRPHYQMSCVFFTQLILHLLVCTRHSKFWYSGHITKMHIYTVIPFTRHFNWDSRCIYRFIWENQLFGNVANFDKSFLFVGSGLIIKSHI